MLSEKVCNDLIDGFEESQQTEQGRTLGGVNLDYKNTLDLGMPEHVSEMLTMRSNKCIDDYVTKFGHVDKWNPETMWGDGTHYPIWNMQKYEKNVGHYNAYHTEENHTQENSHRLFVVMFYINDVKKGGQTLFQYSNLKIQPQRGTFLCWPAGWPWLHAGLKPKSNDKYIITSWLCANWGEQ